LSENFNTIALLFFELYKFDYEAQNPQLPIMLLVTNSKQDFKMAECYYVYHKKMHVCFWRKEHAVAATCKSGHNINQVSKQNISWQIFFGVSL